jgi:Rab GDP dissociation inhibitor
MHKSLIELTDDIRDVYHRAAGEELVVEGLRDGQTLVADEE